MSADAARSSDGPEPVRLEVAVRLDYIAFRSDAEQHRIDVLRVRTVSLMQPAAMLPAIPAFSAGSLSLRGARVPLVDLRARQRASMSPDDQCAADIVVIETDDAPVGAVIDARPDMETLIPGLRSCALTRKLVGNDLLVQEADADAAPLLLVFMDVRPLSRNEPGSP